MQYGIVDSVHDIVKLFNPLIQLIFIEKYVRKSFNFLFFLNAVKFMIWIPLSMLQFVTYFTW